MKKVKANIIKISPYGRNDKLWRSDTLCDHQIIQLIYFQWSLIQAGGRSDWIHDKSLSHDHMKIIVL